MILKVFGVLQVILVQVISAQLSNRDLLRQNALNYLVNTPLAGYSRSRRQIDNLPVGEPGNGNLPANGLANSLLFKNGMTFGNLPRVGGLTNNFGLSNNLDFKNDLPNRFALNNGMALPNNSPLNLPFQNINIVPQNRLLPNVNGININGHGVLPYNITNGFSSLNSMPNGLPNLNNVPNSLPSLNNMPNGLPSLNNVPNGLPSLNNVPNRFPSFNNLPNGLPSFNNVPNGLTSFNNFPNEFPSFNKVPNALPGFDNVPNALPSFNNLPNGLPGFKNEPNALPGFNNMPYELPVMNNMPNALPSLNNVPNSLPGFNKVPNGLPSFNNMANGLPNNNNLPCPNNFLNLNNVPVGQNILNLNNVPAANSLPNINNRLIPSDLPSFNNLPRSNALPLAPPNNGLPLNFLNDNLLPHIKNQLPYLNDFSITGIVIGDGIADIHRFPRNDIPDGSMLLNANNLQDGNGWAQQVADELSNINNYQTNNAFAGFANTSPASTLPNNVPVNNRLTSINNFPKDNDLRNFAVEAQNINNMQSNNDLSDISNVQNYNVMPINEQRFVSNVHFNNDFADANNFQANTVVPNAKSKLVNAINNGMPLANGGDLNEILYAKNGMALNMPETYVQNTDGNGFSRNDFQFGSVQAPINNWHYDFIGAKMPANQNEVQMFSNMPSDHQSVLMSDDLNLAQGLIENLQMEGNIPFLNGMPVAGITETATVLNGPFK